jgi:hypothetical protein
MATILDHRWSTITVPLSPDKSRWSSVSPDVQPWKTIGKMIDEKSYNNLVLNLPPTMSEDEIDDRITLEAQNLGLLPLQLTSDVDGITSSVSTMTIASDSIRLGSVQSQSAPTSCSSSEHRPMTDSSNLSGQTSPERSSRLDDDKKRSSPLRSTFRKMAGFRRKRSVAMPSSEAAAFDSDIDINGSEATSIRSDIRSPGSIKSNKSSWSQPVSVSKDVPEYKKPVDADAVKRSMECEELSNLRAIQQDQRLRFLQFQTSLISNLRAQQELAKNQRRLEQDKSIAEQIEKVR